MSDKKTFTLLWFSGHLYQKDKDSFSRLGAVQRHLLDRWSKFESFYKVNENGEKGAYGRNLFWSPFHQTRSSALQEKQHSHWEILGGRAMIRSESYKSYKCVSKRRGGPSSLSQGRLYSDKCVNISNKK